MVFSRVLVVCAVSLVVALIGAPAATAIVGGTPDETHPYVGSLFRIDGSGQTYFLCTGSLLGSGEFLTAGHCVEMILPGDRAFVSFAPRLDGPLDPFTGATGPQSEDDVVPADAWIVHPAYKAPGANIAVNDVGLVRLAAPVSGASAALPGASAAAVLAHKQPVLTVGYGIDSTAPPTWTGTRQATHLSFNALSSSFLDTLSRGDQGSPCLGDSGAPVFASDDTDVVLALVSWGSFGGCGVGTGHSQRLDVPVIRDWLLQHTYPGS
jgi:V8-like Glu-specific endopeptidase